MLGLTFVTHFIIVSFGVVHALKCRGFRSIPKSKSVANSQLTAANSFSELPIEVFGWSSALTSDFLTNYLQKKKPLLIRQAIPNFATTVPLHYEGLIALASDDDVFARLYKMKGKTILKEYGPFERTAFNKLKLSSKWSLLVQELDRHIPAVADLWYKHFSFMPNWRRDDIMISYSVPGASIGAHVDNYDVFLVQGR